MTKRTTRMTSKAKKTTRNDNKEDKKDKGNNKDDAVFDAEAAFKDCATKLKLFNIFAEIACVVKDGAVYACMVVMDGTRDPDKVHKIYLVMSPNKRLLATRVPGSLKRRLYSALESAFPNVGIDSWPLKRLYFDTVLLETLQRNERIVDPHQDSVAKGFLAKGSLAKGFVAKKYMEEDSVDQDSVDQHSDEDSADEDSTDEDSWNDDSGDEDPVQVEPMLEESMHDTPLETPQPGFSNNGAGSIQEPGISAMEVDGGASVSQDSSQSSSSNDSKPWSSSHTRKRPVVAPVACEDSQPGCSRVNPGLSMGTRPAERAEEKAGARPKRVSRSQDAKREPGRREGVSNENPKATGKSSRKKPGATKKDTKNKTSGNRPMVYKKLQDLWFDIQRFQLDVDEMKESLKDTYDVRRQIGISPLPKFFVEEDILCTEAELRFGYDIETLEKKLTDAARIFSEAQHQDYTLRELCEFLEEGTSPSLVTEGSVPKNRTDDAPRIYKMGGCLSINAGTMAETVKIASGRLERALVLCLVLYYVKLLYYPEAFWRVMYVLQLILNPSDDPPIPPTRSNGEKCVVTERMRYLSDLLERNMETNELEAE
ncbi:hypothetical protein MTO96_049448 [Rhipicephalus appendiculatus]